MRREIRAFSNLGRLLTAAKGRRRVQLFLTVLLTVAGAIAETVTIGAVWPLLAVAASPGSIERVPFVTVILGVVTSAINVNQISAAAILLAAAALFATIIRLLLTWVSQQFVYGLLQDLVMEVFGRSLRQPYEWYVGQNSSVLLAGLEKIYSVVVGAVGPLLTALSYALIAACVIILMCFLNPGAALAAAISLGSIYLVMSAAVSGTLRIISAELATLRTARIKTVQETLGGIRDIMLDQTQELFESSLLKLESRQRRLLVLGNFFQLAPRVVVEGFVIILVAIMAAWFSKAPGGLIGAIPMLGALGVGAQRLLPMVQAIYVGWSGYAIHAHNLQDVVELLNAPVEQEKHRIQGVSVSPFKDAIELRHVTYVYPEGRTALTNINLSISKGESIGIIGKTGSGKSTLVDIIMGLLKPSEGHLIVDGVVMSDEALLNWRAQIAHVPQAIFLTDGSIAANIAFGSDADAIDLGRVETAAQKAGIADFVNGLVEGMETIVGERGIRLSGGQRQRIGIARALYKQASVLIFDEATSALDDETEVAVMDAITGLDSDLTVILIAHRVSSIAKCNRVYQLRDGLVAREGSYDEVVLESLGEPPDKSINA